MNMKKLGMLALLGSLILSFVLINGCIHHEDNTTKPETETQIIEDLTAKEAYALIQEHKDNPNFVILDVRTPEEFLAEHIEDAVNLDYHSNTFKNELDKLDKNKTYLIYCRSGHRSGNALNIMKGLDFRETYNILGGIIKWKAEGFPTTK